MNAAASFSVKAQQLFFFFFLFSTDARRLWQEDDPPEVQREEPPAEVRLAELRRSANHPTLLRLLWWPDKRPLPGEGDAQPEPDTGSSLSDTKQTAELWHFDPSPPNNTTTHTERLSPLSLKVNSIV